MIIKVADSKDRDAWLAARKRYWTASEVACILDVGFQTAQQLADAKKSNQPFDEEVGNLAFVASGRHMEAGILAWFAEETPHLEFEHNTWLMHRPVPGDPPVAATPDAVFDGEPVDSKLVRFEAFSNWTKFGSRDEYANYEWASDITFTHVVKRFPPITYRVAKQDAGTPRGDWRAAVVEAYQRRLKLGPLQVPLKYVVQLHVQMYVLDAPAGWMTACIGGDTRLDFRVLRSAKLEKHWLSEVARFHESIGGLNE